jgi:hypothetical protein
MSPTHCGRTQIRPRLEQLCGEGEAHGSEVRHADEPAAAMSACVLRLTAPEHALPQDAQQRLELGALLRRLLHRRGRRRCRPRVERRRGGGAHFGHGAACLARPRAGNDVVIAGSGGQCAAHAKLEERL